MPVEYSAENLRKIGFTTRSRPSCPATPSVYIFHEIFFGKGYPGGNTVKYRLHLIQDLLGYVPGKMPDAFPLYLAVSLHRLMNQ